MTGKQIAVVSPGGILQGGVGTNRCHHANRAINTVFAELYLRTEPCGSTGNTTMTRNVNGAILRIITSRTEMA